jgi:SAM-dependent methyltransferase
VTALPPRLELARDLVLERTDGFVLELGCGAGVLAAALMGPVDEYLGVDRSAHAVAASRERLAALDTPTRWTVHHGTVDTLPAPPAPVDLAVAVNVNLFWTGPARRELDRLSSLLSPLGVLVLVFETPDGAGNRVLDPLGRSLGGSGWGWGADRRGASLAVVASRERRAG